MHHDYNASATLKDAVFIDGFTTWLIDSPEDIEDAAELLGGQKWRAISRRITIAAKAGADLSVLLPDLAELSRLLNLHYADDLGSAEADRFMAVHPEDPRADNARRCAESLDCAIAALRRVQPLNARRAA